ncbi:LysR family transcriptional regulator [Halarcobacter mediterraneus]|uniref:LysR family transcriptional regulator n=1 Tax=Halarcobacter mediterraneus TaxID=2023153 RepID=A0A4Q1B2N4_9BACT|nr:LysR family transcriptional regulator [Halarcobacter mediterraneus]RXK12189.1 LysR family transcriptional regulator [Halarcobacter mediterraneus]
MDSNLLKVFIKVANTKSISQAAKELEFTQSNVTLRIKQLEKNIGYSLFHRTNRGVILTNEGEKLFPYAMDIIKKVEEAQVHMRNIDYQEVLKIGSTQTFTTSNLMPFLEKLNSDFKQMNLEFAVDSSLNLIDKLLDYKLDIAFVNGNPNHKDIEILNVVEEKMVLVEPLNKEPQKTCFVFKKSCSNCATLESYIKNTRDENYKTVELENFELILGCIKAGFGIGLLSPKIIEKFGYTNKVKTTDIENHLDTHLICRKDYLPIIHEYLRKVNL